MIADLENIPDLQPGDLVNTKEAAKIIGSTPGTMAVWRIQGKGPRFCKIQRSVRYYRPHLKEFVLGNCRISTSQA